MTVGASERDVVFTPFMLRVRGTLVGAAPRSPVRVRPSAVRPVAATTHEWFSLRARCEQLVAEANAMLGGRFPALEFDDEAGTDRLAFRLRCAGESARFLMLRTGRRAWLELHRSGPRVSAPVELVDLAALEDLIVDMLTATAGGSRDG